MRSSFIFLTLIMVLFLPLLTVRSTQITGPVAIVSNSIDMPTAKRMKSFFEAMDLRAKIFLPQEYDEALKYGQFVVVLGGHKAPEGVGQISSSLLSEEEKSKLERRNFAYYFVKIGPNRKPVVVVAGNDRYGTYRAANTFLLRGLDELESMLSSPGVAMVVVGIPKGKGG